MADEVKTYSAKEERRLAALLCENGDDDVMVREIVRCLYVICRGFVAGRAYSLGYEKSVSAVAERRMQLAISNCVQRGLELNFNEFQLEPWFLRETING